MTVNAATRRAAAAHANACRWGERPRAPDPRNIHAMLALDLSGFSPEKALRIVKLPLFRVAEGDSIAEIEADEARGPR